MSPVVKLSFDLVAGPAVAKRRIVLVHGMLGSGTNLRTLARRFVAARPGWDAWLVDLRGHGASPKGSPDPSIAAAAADIHELCAASAVPIVALVGHSFGGKVVLAAARTGGLVSLRHVVTLDTNPGTRTPPLDGEGVTAILALLERQPATFPSRAAFVDAVVGSGRPRPLAQWLAMNLVAAPGGVRLAVDLGELRGLLSSYFASDLWPVIEAPPKPIAVHLVIAERSTSYGPEDRARALSLRGPGVTVDLLATDHWLHAEDPDGVVRLLLSYLAE